MQAPSKLYAASGYIAKPTINILISKYGVPQWENPCGEYHYSWQDDIEQENVYWDKDMHSAKQKLPRV